MDNQKSDLTNKRFTVAAAATLGAVIMAAISVVAKLSQSLAPTDKYTVGAVVIFLLMTVGLVGSVMVYFPKSTSIRTGGGFLAVLCLLTTTSLAGLWFAGSSLWSTGNETLPSLSPIAGEFFLCIGEYQGACQAISNSEFAPCATDPQLYARQKHGDVCRSKIDVASVSSRSGNRCGYSTLLIRCHR